MINRVPVLLIVLLGLVLLSVVTADQCARWADSSWRWIWPIAYAVIFRFVANPIVTGFRLGRRYRRALDRVDRNGDQR